MQQHFAFELLTVARGVLQIRNPPLAENTSTIEQLYHQNDFLRQAQADGAKNDSKVEAFFFLRKT